MQRATKNPALSRQTWLTFVSLVNPIKALQSVPNQLPLKAYSTKWSNHPVLWPTRQQRTTRPFQSNIKWKVHFYQKLRQRPSKIPKNCKNSRKIITVINNNLMPCPKIVMAVSLLETKAANEIAHWSRQWQNQFKAKNSDAKAKILGQLQNRDLTVGMILVICVQCLTKTTQAYLSCLHLPSIWPLFLRHPPLKKWKRRANRTAK